MLAICMHVGWRGLQFYAEFEKTPEFEGAVVTCQFQGCKYSFPPLL